MFDACSAVPQSSIRACIRPHIRPPGALQETIELLKVLDASGQVAGILLLNFVLKTEIDFLHYIQKYPVVQVMEAVIWKTTTRFDGRLSGRLRRRFHLIEQEGSV